jgi:uracil-DNA glycosylase
VDPAGVLVLNRALTTAPGKPAAQRGKGWEEVTEQAIRALVACGGPSVAILWWRDARNRRPLLVEVPAIESAHPGPTSASYGFFGSRPFSWANDLVAQQGRSPLLVQSRPDPRHDEAAPPGRNRAGRFASCRHRV